LEILSHPPAHGEKKTRRNEQKQRDCGKLELGVCDFLQLLFRERIEVAIMR
jgi:hypothetical protein